MANKTYSEKLKDPRWQKKRLDILNRDEFTCQMCLDKETTLNVHHYAYKRGKEPWEYEDDMLVTYCQDCHESETINRPGLEEDILQLLREAKTNQYDLVDFRGYLRKSKNIRVELYGLTDYLK